MGKLGISATDCAVLPAGLCAVAMAPEGLQLFFRFALFVIVASLLSIANLPRDSAEFVVSVLALITGVVLAALVMLVEWWSRR